MPQKIDSQWKECPICHVKYDKFIEDCPARKYHPTPSTIIITEIKIKKNIFSNVIWPSK